MCSEGVEGDERKGGQVIVGRRRSLWLGSIRREMLLDESGKSGDIRMGTQDRKWV